MPHHPNPAALTRVQLRSRNGLLLEAPFVAASTPWAATLWPDLRLPGGWARSYWGPSLTHRGWELPVDLALGDVVEFGGASATTDERWWGIVDEYEPDVGLTLIGPQPSPDEAQLLVQELLSQQAPPPLTLVGQRTRRCHHR